MARRRQQNPFTFGGFEFDDSEHVRRVLADLGFGDVLPSADGTDDEDEEPAAPVPGFGERVRRPYATTVEPEVVATATHAEPRTTRRLDINTPHALRQDDPLLNAIIESSQSQIESMGAELMEWKMQSDMRDAEIRSLKESNRRLLAEKQFLEAQLSAIRQIIDTGPGKEKSKDGGPSRSEEKQATHNAQKPTQKPTQKPPTAPAPVKPEETNGFEKPGRRGGARGGYRYRGSRKPNSQPHRQPEHTRPRRAKTIFDLPRELINSIVDYLSPPANPKKRLDPVRETSKLFDRVWNKDLDNWSRTCTRFSRILRSNYWWKVIQFDDEDPVGWHEKAEQISPKNRAFVR